MIISRDCKSLLISFMLVTIPMHVSAMIRESSLDGEDLRLAAMNGNSKVVERCLDAGINVDAKNQNGITALRLASDKGHSDVVNLLLKHRANVNERGQGALIVASDKGHENIASLLLKYGAIIDEKNQHGPTALKFASRKGHAGIVDLLLNHVAYEYASVVDLSLNHVAYEYASVVDLSLNHVAYEIDENMLNNVLKYAASKKNSNDNDTANKMIKTIEVLVKHGANLDIEFNGKDIFTFIRNDYEHRADNIIEAIQKDANEYYHEMVKALDGYSNITRIDLPSDLTELIACFATNYYYHLQKK